MEGLIDLELASEVERKVYLAFLKGLMQIKFRSQIKKEQQARQRASTTDEADETEFVDLEYLYSNLFASSSI